MNTSTDQTAQELQKREKSELIVIIKLMLQHQPDLAWILQTPLSDTARHEQAPDASLYRHQIAVAVSAVADHHRDRTYREKLQTLLQTLQTLASEFAARQNYVSAFAVYEALASESIRSYFSLETGYLIFSPVLVDCIDGLDSCLAEYEDDPQEHQMMRLSILKALYRIHRFSTTSSLNLGDDIPDLLTGNATPAERKEMAGWVREDLARMPEKAETLERETFLTFRRLLDRLEK